MDYVVSNQRSTLSSNFSTEQLSNEMKFPARPRPPKRVSAILHLIFIARFQVIMTRLDYSAAVLSQRFCDSCVRVSIYGFHTTFSTKDASVNAIVMLSIGNKRWFITIHGMSEIQYQSSMAGEGTWIQGL